MPRARVPVYAIVRVDRFKRSIQDQVAVQAVLPSIEEARAEVDRLNALRDEESVIYFLRATRFYPDGRGHVTDNVTLTE